MSTANARISAGAQACLPASRTGTPARDRPSALAPACRGVRELLLGASVLACTLVCMTTAGVALAATSSQLKPSEYGVSSLCSAPTPGYSACLGLRLVAREPNAQPGARALTDATPSGEEAEQESSESEDGESPIGESLSGTTPPTQATEFTKPNKKALTPANLLTAYNVDGATPPTTQTIAIVDAFDDATIASDLQVFSTQFGLPACNEANGCFRKVNQFGTTTPLPASAGELERGWAQEIATDVETAHGLCPACHIVLVEAESNSNANLYAAEQTAATLGATEISNSWGGGEPSTDSQVFDHPGVAVVASAGDYGYLNWFSETAPESADYPASSPHVVAVGGTRLNLNASTKAWESETVWNDGGFAGGAFKGSGAGGGGCSVPFVAPAWQQSLPNWSSVGCGSSRAVADISADADPYTGIAVYDSTETEGNRGWATIGGTSVAAPIVASLFALAGGAHGVAYPARTLYENQLLSPASLHDVTVGSNGECRKPFEKGSGTSGCTVAEQAQTCSATAICLAGSGYDGPTGVGTPDGLAAFAPPGTFSSASGETVEPSPAGSGGGAASAPPGTSSPGTSPPAPGAAALAKPVVSALSLTRSARAALVRRHPKLSTLGVTFTLNAPARLRVTIYKLTRVRGRLVWKAVSAPLTIAATGGSQSRKLSGHTPLAAGRYRLTLTPERGAARSISFQVA
jgi:hypothetical protein